MVRHGCTVRHNFGRSPTAAPYIFQLRSYFSGSGRVAIAARCRRIGIVVGKICTPPAGPPF
eukprot:769193-Prymnesium_polylepis.1